MDTRRKFIAKGSMAAAALLVTKPFNAIAGNTSFFQPFSGQNHLVFIHTGSLQEASHQSTLKFIGAIKNKTSNALLLDASVEKASAGLAFDSTLSGPEGYSILTKGGIRTGIITINKDEEELIDKINNIASMLKNEKNCKVVVCMSRLGYSNKNKCDDKDLAEKSQDIDIIIGANAENFAKHPVIKRNSQKHEVILQSASSSEALFGKIEIGFDAKGNKNHVHILNKVPGKEGQQNCIVAA